MKILLVEDKLQHIEAAKYTLAGHDLTVAATVDEAFKYFERPVNYDLRKSLLARYNREAGFPEDTNPYSVENEADREKLLEIDRRAYAEARPKWEFEAVLTDMLMPNSDRAGGNRGLLDKESPYGLTFIWRAVACGAKYVGLLTDMNHHKHTMSAALDHFPLNTIFQVESSRVIICREFNSYLIAEQQCSKCQGSGKRIGHDGKEEECWMCRGSGKHRAEGKDWGTVLRYLTGEEVIPKR